MSFNEIFCQDRAVSILQKAFSADKVPHAYIFAGTEGVGKFKTAIEWGRLLLCKNPVKEKGFADSCGKCQSCRAFEGDSHPDFVRIYKELVQFTREGKGKKAAVELSIDVIREYLIEKVAIRPSLSGRRVFVVCEAEKLNKFSQNSLLKVLEEPPDYCCIILLCTRPEKLLATIRSRCQTIRFGPIEQAIILEQVKQVGVNGQKAKYFARLAQGSIGQASQLAQLESADVEIYRTKKEIVDSIAGYEYGESLDLAERFLDESKRIAEAWAGFDEISGKTEMNRRAAKLIIRIIISVFQDAMKMEFASAEIVNADQKEQIKKLTGRFGPEEAAERISDCYRAESWIEANVNEKLIFEHLLLKMVVFDKMQD